MLSPLDMEINLTRQQLENLYNHMDEMAANSRHFEDLATTNIRSTNWVVYILAGLGVIIVILILSYFTLLNKAISHSLNSMLVINKQASELRYTMDNITSSIANMDGNIKYLRKISSSANQINQTTQQMNSYMLQLEQQTTKLGSDTRFLSSHATTINQNFSQINQSVSNISSSVHQAVKPIKQFIPIP